MFKDRVIKFNIYEVYYMGFIFYWNRFIRFVYRGFEIVEIMYRGLVNKYVNELNNEYLVLYTNAIKLLVFRHLMNVFY